MRVPPKVQVRTISEPASTKELAAGLEPHLLQIRTGCPIGYKDFPRIESFEKFVHGFSIVATEMLSRRDLILFSL
jgi:hypothetical protein